MIAGHRDVVKLVKPYKGTVCFVWRRHFFHLTVTSGMDEVQALKT